MLYSTVDPTKAPAVAASRMSRTVAGVLPGRAPAAMTSASPGRNQSGTPASSTIRNRNSPSASLAEYNASSALTIAERLLTRFAPTTRITLAPGWRSERTCRRRPRLAESTASCPLDCSGELSGGIVDDDGAGQLVPEFLVVAVPDEAVIHRGKR